MPFSQAQVEAYTEGFDELDAGRIRAVCRYLAECEQSGAAGLSARDRAAVSDTANRVLSHSDAKARGEILVASFERINQIRMFYMSKAEVSEKDQDRVHGLLQSLLTRFEATAKGTRARALLDVAGQRRWTRREFNEAEGYVVEFADYD